MTEPAATADPFDLARMTLRASAGLMLRNARRLLQLLERPAPRLVRWLAVVAAIDALAGAVLPYATKRLVDGVIAAHGAVAGPAFWLVVEAVVVTLQAGAHHLARYLTRMLEIRAAPFLAERVLEKTSRVAYRDLETTGFLDRVSRARQDAAHYGVHYAVQMVMVGRWLLAFTGCAGVLVWIAPLWILPVVAAAVVLPFVLEVSRARRSFAIEQQNLHGNRQAWYVEWLLSSVEPAKEIRATGIGPWLVGLHARIHAPFVEGKVALARRHHRRSWLAAIIATGALYGPYGYFLAETVRGARTLGDLLLFMLAFRQATSALGQLLTAFAAAFEHHLYVENLLQVLDHPEPPHVEIDPAPRAERVLAEAPALVLDDVWFRYPGAREPVLRGLDLEVRAGETLAIVGRNGIGKTTLVKLLLGLYPLERGAIRIAGVDAATQTEGWRRDNVGIVFQDFVRYHFSARWNIGLGWSPASDDDDEITRAMQMAEASRIVGALPAGLDTPLGPAFGGPELSGGQWQRIALARLFMRKSRLWILDEPTSAMDPETEERTVRCFRQWTQGRTAIVITHRFSTARVADRVAVIDGGRVTEVGSHDQLIAAGRDYARLFSTQARAYVAE